MTVFAWRSAAQSLYAQQIPGFQARLTVLGKVIGGGMPLADFGGLRAVMEQLAPLGPVYQVARLATRYRPVVGDAA